MNQAMRLDGEGPGLKCKMEVAAAGGEKAESRRDKGKPEVGCAKK
jgi:hypothetical protein